MKFKDFFKIFFIAFLACVALTACEGNDDEPDDPNKGSGSDVNVENINGTWKGIFKGYTGTRDELITIIFSGSGNEGSVRIWWTHYLNMGQYYFTGDYKLSGNKLTLDGKMGQHGQIPSKPYNKTVTVKFIDKETMEFEFDVDTWIVTKR